MLPPARFPKSFSRTRLFLILLAAAIFLRNAIQACMAAGNIVPYGMSQDQAMKMRQFYKMQQDRADTVRNLINMYVWQHPGDPNARMKAEQLYGHLRAVPRPGTPEYQYQLQQEWNPRYGGYPWQRPQPWEMQGPLPPGYTTGPEPEWGLPNAAATVAKVATAAVATIARAGDVR
jgi:hypothetical protein